MEITLIDDIWDEIQRLVRQPRPTICGHSVDKDLLSILEVHGECVAPDLAKAIGHAEDDRALDLLQGTHPCRTKTNSNG